MINIKDIKIIAEGLCGNVLIWLTTFTEWDIFLRLICYIFTTGATVYFLHKNSKNKK